MKELLYSKFNKELVDSVLKSKKYRKILSTPQKIDLKLCIDLYLNYKLPIYKIAMLYGISDGTLRSYFIKANVPLKGHRIGKNSFNNYFETINSADKAYFLGLIVADGNIYSGNNKKRLQISLTDEDKYILERFNNYAKFNTNLIVSHPEDTKPRQMLAVTSIKIYDDLVKYGIKENKSHKSTHIPNIPKYLIPHFIRGYFDGDGIAKKEGYIGFCGSYEIISEIKNELIKECNVKDNKITYNKSNHIYYIQWGSKEDIKSIFNYLYKNKQDLYLTRKYNKIKNKL